LLASRAVSDLGDRRDLAALVLPELGSLVETGEECEPFRLLDVDGGPVVPVAEYFAELQAADSSPLTVRSYGHDLLRWWRFLHAVGVSWNEATRVEARDFMRWMLLADKPVRTHWRHRAAEQDTAGPSTTPTSRRPAAGAVIEVTGKTKPGRKYSPASRAHAETVLRAFYEFHLEAGTGPIVNPFPLDRSRRGGRAHAHHNPMEPFARTRVGRYRPKLPTRLPRRIPDEQFDQLLLGLGHNRDRALLAFWVSTGARAEELLGAAQRHADPGDQLITVTRKGSRAQQHLAASPDAFVWLRLYQEELWRQGAPRGRNKPLWCTLRRPWRPLTYPAARAMFTRAQALLGSDWTLHDLRHTAAHRMVEDPEMSITDVQEALGHASLTTTQLYSAPTADDVVASTLAHHRRRAEAPSATGMAPPSPGYNPESLRVLLGGRG
jgi:site-specific recombinase XerD